MLPLHPSNIPIRTSSPARPRTPQLSFVPLPPSRTIQIQHTRAVRRGAAAIPGGAAQLPSHRGGRYRHRGAVIGCRAPQTLQPQRGLGRPAGGRRRRGRPGCPDAGHAVRRSVRVLCPPCGRTSVQLVGRTSGVQATGVHATGVMRVSGQTGVRCPRPLRPRCPHRAGSGIRRCGGTGHVGAAGSTCRCGPRAAWSSLPESGLAGKGWSNVGAWLARGSTLDLGRRFAFAQAAAPRSPPRDQGSWSSARCRSVGRGTREGAGAHTSPCRWVLGRLPA
jgi:hypothetical protein